MTFKQNDIVYHHKHGKGVIVAIDSWWVNVLFKNDTTPRCIYCEWVSFTPYIMVGFTQKRPHQHKAGDLVLCSMSKNARNWFIRFYSHTNNEGYHFTSQFPNLDGACRMAHIKPYNHV
jgi:hypothetical protein